MLQNRVQNFGERERERARASGSEQLARSLALKLKKCSSRSLARLKIENVSARSLALARHYFQRASARSSRSSLAFFARSSFKLARSSSSLSCFDRDMVVCSNKSKLSTELRLTNWVGEKETESVQIGIKGIGHDPQNFVIIKSLTTTATQLRPLDSFEHEKWFFSLRMSRFASTQSKPRFIRTSVARYSEWYAGKRFFATRRTHSF